MVLLTITVSFLLAIVLLQSFLKSENQGICAKYKIEAQYILLERLLLVVLLFSC